MSAVTSDDTKNKKSLNKRSFKPQLSLQSADVPTIFIEKMGDTFGISPLFSKSSPKSLKRKKVSFYKTISVILVPSLEEYRAENLYPLLWYDEIELRVMERNAVLRLSLGKYFSE
jgi:hypothetical protein